MSKVSARKTVRHFTPTRDSLKEGRPFDGVFDVAVAHHPVLKTI